MLICHCIDFKLSALQLSK